MGIAIGLAIRHRNEKLEAREQKLVVANHWFALIWFFIGLPTLVVAPLVVVGEAPIFHWTYPVAIVVLFPNVFVRLLTLPLGAVRSTYRLSLLANFTWTLRPRTGALCAALLARFRRPEPFGSLPVDSWLTDRTKPPQGILVSTDLLADALTSCLRGDLQRCRILMETILRYPTKACGRQDGRLAREWLLLDAAAHGHWHRVGLIHGPWARWTRLGAFLNQVSLGLALRAAESPVEARSSYFRRSILVLSWSTAPRPWATRPLMLRAWRSVRPDQASEADPTLEASSEEGFAPAIREALTRSALGTDPSAAALAWQEALGSLDFEPWLSRRAEVLSIDVGQAEQAIHESVAAAWEEMSTSTGVALNPALAGGWLGSRHTQLLNSLEEAAEVLEALSENPDEVEPIRHLEAWLALRRRFDEALQSGVDLGLAVYQVHDAIWNWSAELFNTQGQKSLAHSLFAWLHDYALALGDQETAEQMRDNLKLDV